MRLSVQRRLGLPLDVACQAAAAGKKTRNGKTHDEYGDAAVNVPQQGHNTRHKYTLRRLILALRSAWGTAVRMEPKAHLGKNSDPRRQGARANGRLRDTPTSWAGAGVLLPSFSRPAAS